MPWGIIPLIRGSGNYIIVTMNSRGNGTPVSVTVNIPTDGRGIRRLFSYQGGSS